MEGHGVDAGLPANPRVRPLGLAVAALLMCAQFAAADIRVSPAALYLSDEVRNERLYIENNGTQDVDSAVHVRIALIS